MAVQQNDELLATKAVQAVVIAKARPQQTRHQQQYFVADQVTMGVVHTFEVVDVDDAEPDRRLVTRGAPAGLGARGFVGRPVRARQKGCFEGLPVQKPGQWIALAVIEQVVEVAENPQARC